MERVKMEGREMFNLSQTTMEKIRPVALEMGETEEAVLVPGLEGQVLVRLNTKAHYERDTRADVFRIPVELDTIIAGKRVRMGFLLCSV